jgi:hypothetical protein
MSNGDNPTLVATPYTAPTAIGLPIVSPFDTFQPEGCRDAPRRISLELTADRPDAEQIVQALARLALAYGKSECVVNFAKCMIEDITANNDTQGMFSRITKFLVEQVIYVADPLGAEYVRSPVQLLRQWEDQGSAQGDCDDHVLLANSLFNALGFKTRVVALKVFNDAVFDHVICSVLLQGTWYDFDPCNKSDPFHAYPGDRVMASA